MTDDGWQCYIDAFHDSRPGITERVLGTVESAPYRWLVEPLRGIRGLIVDVACGCAPSREQVPHAWWLGVDASAGELAAAATAGRGPVVRARADALPFRSEAVHAVCAAMCLPVLTPLVGVLDEIVRGPVACWSRWFRLGSVLRREGGCVGRASCARSAPRISRGPIRGPAAELARS